MAGSKLKKKQKKSLKNSSAYRFQTFNIRSKFVFGTNQSINRGLVKINHGSVNLLVWDPFISTSTFEHSRVVMLLPPVDKSPLKL